MGYVGVLTTLASVRAALARRGARPNVGNLLTGPCPSSSQVLAALTTAYSLGTAAAAVGGTIAGAWLVSCVVVVAARAWRRRSTPSPPPLLSPSLPRSSHKASSSPQQARRPPSPTPPEWSNPAWVQSRGWCGTRLAAGRAASRLQRQQHRRRPAPASHDSGAPAPLLSTKCRVTPPEDPGARCGGRASQTRSRWAGRRTQPAGSASRSAQASPPPPPPPGPPPPPPPL